jgi:hypothetical protein
MDITPNCPAPSLINSAGILSIPGDLGHFSLLIAISTWAQALEALLDVL